MGYLLNEENERLRDLYALKQLNAPPDRRLNAIVQHAAALCDTPIALISLIDRDRQWFRAKKGLDATETPRSCSFCNHAIRGEEVYEVKDAAQDPDFADNPLVTGSPHIRFYAGAPLITKSGRKIGTLCVIDQEPRDGLSQEQRTELAELAEHVINEFYDPRTQTGDNR